MPNEKAPVRGTEDMEKPAPGTTTPPGTTKGKTEMNEKPTTPDTSKQQPATPSEKNKKETPKSPNY